MRVKDAMTRDVCIANPEQTLQDAASKMAERDIGFLPVGENDRLIGMITDRDIAVRAIARGKGARDRVREAMTEDIKCCFEDDDTAVVARRMAEQQVRRLPVLDREKRLVGIVSLADIATREEPLISGHALSGISRRGGEHCQSTGSERGAHR